MNKTQNYIIFVMITTIRLCKLDECDLKSSCSINRFTETNECYAAHIEIILLLGER
jgi:hypothetical protein